MHLGSIRLCRYGFVAIAITGMSAGPAASEKVGVTAAVNPSVTGHQPGQSERQLKIGSDVVHNERIRSTSEGSMQIVFVDRTTLTISPNSDITINEYVFDRNANSGNITVTVGKGLLNAPCFILLRGEEFDLFHSATRKTIFSRVRCVSLNSWALRASASGSTVSTVICTFPASIR